MALSLCVIQWGGHIFDSGSGGNPIEIWSNTIHAMADTTYDMNQMAADGYNSYSTVIDDVNARIHDTVSIDWTKASRVDITTGAWTTDPVGYYAPSVGVRGNNSTNVPPTYQSCRISLDDGTRNRKAKGGFYLPRVAMALGDDGKWNSSQLATFMTEWKGMLVALMAASTLELTVGVYSKSSASFTTSTRLRVGAVPDVIRRRKNALLEGYLVTTL